MFAESCKMLRKPCRPAARHTEEEERRKSRSEKRWAAQTGGDRSLDHRITMRRSRQGANHGIPGNCGARDFRKGAKLKQTMIGQGRGLI